MIINCSKCSSRTDCQFWQDHEFTKCYKYRQIVSEKRAEIAIEAMKAMLSNPSLVIGSKNDTPDKIANVSVTIADELMKLLK